MGNINGGLKKNCKGFSLHRQAIAIFQ